MKDKKKIDDFVKLIDWVKKSDKEKLRQLSGKQKAAARKVIDDYVDMVSEYFTGGSNE